uniref:Uncharacterized protein n=1 Tax=Aegilops tauschii subsp. strangulata TaxID=200361 RepID=A0A453NXE3_AEGTS
AFSDCMLPVVINTANWRGIESKYFHYNYCGLLNSNGLPWLTGPSIPGGRSTFLSWTPPMLALCWYCGPMSTTKVLHSFYTSSLCTTSDQFRNQVQCSNKDKLVGFSS